MATRSARTDSFSNFAGFRSVDEMRRKLFEAPAEAGRAQAIGSAMETVEFLRMLPEAFVGTQQRELERLRKTGDENNPHIDVLETSLQQAEALRTMAQRGYARVQRAATIAVDPENAFHGFVAGADLAPIEGITVRLVTGGGNDDKLSAVTASDGYFRIPLGTRREPGSWSARGGLTDRLAGMSARFSRRSAAAPAPDPAGATGQQTLARVEIVSNGRVVHSDPTPVTLESGRLYREYVVSDPGRPRAEAESARTKRTRRKGR